MCSVSGQSFRLRRLRTMRQTVGSSMFSQVRLACEQALPLGYSREFTWQPHAKGERVWGAGKDLLFPTPRGFAVRSRVFSLRAPKLENSESTFRIKGLSVRTILWGAFCYSCSIIRKAREKKMPTRAPFESHGVSRLFLSQLAYYARHSCVLG